MQAARGCAGKAGQTEICEILCTLWAETSSDRLHSRLDLCGFGNHERAFPRKLETSFPFFLKVNWFCLRLIPFSSADVSFRKHALVQDAGD
jgi:hypothetical protein